VNRRELRIYAQRGALELSYHDETKGIPEGAAYRVLLDPSEKEAAASASVSATRKPVTVHAKFF
jgi:hypothetical protein